MKPIIIATDFSDVANNAVKFGCNMARDFGASVVIIHSYVIPVTFNDDPLMTMPMNDTYLYAEERLQHYINELKQQFSDIDIHKELMIGLVADCINDYVHDNEVGLVVIGNGGEGGASLLLGSNVKSVLKHLKHLVVAIPPDTQYHKPEKICFACDFQENKNIHSIEKLALFIQLLGAQLHIVNVCEQGANSTSTSQVESSDVYKVFKQLTPTYHMLHGKDTNEVINDFVMSHSMDWLVVAPHHYSFLESIFHKSHTVAMIHISKVPLLSIHE